MSYLFNLSSFPQLSTPSACLAAIVFTSEYETTSSIFMRIKQEPHQLWMASINYVFGDGLLYYCFAAFVITVFRSSYVRKGVYNCAEKVISKKLNGPFRKWKHSGMSVGQSRFVIFFRHIEEAYCFAAFVITVFRSRYVRKGLYNCAEKVMSKKLNGPFRKWKHSGMSVGQSRFVVSVKFMQV